MKYTKPYEAPVLTVDAVIFRISDNHLEVLLMRRPNEPFKGSLALPGGYNPAGETTTEALERIIKQKTGVSPTADLSYLEQLYTFDTIDRDPRGHAVSVTYLGLVRSISDDTLLHGVSFMPVASLPELAYDHASIISYAHERLMSKMAYTNIVSSFLPRKFTLTQLQNVYDVVFGREFDKRNFRKKFLSLGLITETSETWREGAHRPAKLYVFNSDGIETLARSFD